RTASLVTHGRRSAYRRGLSRISKVAVGAVIGAVLVAILVVVMAQGGASWPASVAVVQGQTEIACQNPDVRSEPGQVNFACARATRPILWVFALLTSHNNPSFTDRADGAGADHADPGRSGGGLAEPAPPLQPVQSGGQHPGGRARAEQHHWRGHTH